ncbi:hypothetical protein GCM10010273_19310 [Streptomyces lavendulocolor]
MRAPTGPAPIGYVDEEGGGREHNPLVRSGRAAVRKREAKSRTVRADVPRAEGRYSDTVARWANRRDRRIRKARAGRRRPRRPVPAPRRGRRDPPPPAGGSVTPARVP